MSGDGHFLSRWSRRKIEARRGETPAEPPELAGTQPAAAPSPTAPMSPALPEAESKPVELPPVESLTPESDFTPFMKPEVDLGVRNQALKALFKDPQFNVMDGLDVYIDDYSKPDPLPEGWLEKMTQMTRLGAYEPPQEAAEEAVVPPEAEPAQALAAEVPQAPPEVLADAPEATPGTPAAQAEEASKI